MAAALSLVNGVWTTAAGLFWNQFFGAEPGDLSCAGSCSLLGVVPITLVAHIVLVLGVILLIDSIVWFLAFLRGFYVFALLSVIILFLVLVSVAGSWQVWASYPAIPISIVLGIATIVLDMVAARRKTYVSDEHHPLNLPVFG